jgi:hypothetical protein
MRRRHLRMLTSIATVPAGSFPAGIVAAVSSHDGHGTPTAMAGNCIRRRMYCSHRRGLRAAVANIWRMYFSDGMSPMPILAKAITILFGSAAANDQGRACRTTATRKALRRSRYGALSVLVAGTLAAGGAAAQTPADRQARPMFEFEAGGGSQWGRFATVGPYGNLSTDSPRTSVGNAQASAASDVFEAHALFRPTGAQPFAISAYRFDFRYGNGSVDTNDSLRKNGVGNQFQVPGVDGSFLTGISAAVAANIFSNVRQGRTFWRATPSMVWEWSNAAAVTAVRFGVGYAGMRQDETISLAGFDALSGSTQLDVTATGTLNTHAVGLTAGIDLRLPLQPSLALVLMSEGHLDFARTSYDGRSTDNTVVASTQTIGQTRDHLMTDLRAGTGFEWMTTNRLTLKVMGEAGWQHGAPHIAYPQFGYSASGNLTTTTSGPAHVELEDRWYYGVRGAAVLRF